MNARETTGGIGIEKPTDQNVLRLTASALQRYLDSTRWKLITTFSMEPFENHLRSLTPAEIQAHITMNVEQRPEWKNLIRFLYAAKGVNTGHAAVWVDPVSQDIDITSFFPLGKLEGLELQRTGIGTLAHVKLLEWLHRHMEPGFYVRHPETVSDSRRHQIKKILGLPDASEWRINTLRIPLPEYLEKATLFARERGFIFPDSAAGGDSKESNV